MNIIKRLRRTTSKYLFVAQRCKNRREIFITLIKGNKPSSVVLEDGIHVYAPENNELLKMMQEIFFENAYTPSNLSIEANDTVVDLGANIGVFTLFAARKTRSPVYAFEPFPESFEYLSRNVQTNGLHNVIAHDKAVYDKIGTAKLFLHKSSGRHLISPDYAKTKLERYVEVPTTTLRQIMDGNNLKQIDFLKLDCEGSEATILPSTPLEYLQRIRKIAMEFHDSPAGSEHKKIESLLMRAGFATWLRWDGTSRFGYLYGLKNG